MPTMEKKSRTKCQPRLAFCPVGILSGWHLVHTPFPSGNWAIGPERERRQDGESRWDITTSLQLCLPCRDDRKDSSSVNGCDPDCLFFFPADVLPYIELVVTNTQLPIRGLAADVLDSTWIDLKPLCQVERTNIFSTSPSLSCILVDINEKHVSFWHCPNYQFNIDCSFILMSFSISLNYKGSNFLARSQDMSVILDKC